MFAGSEQTSEKAKRIAVTAKEMSSNRISAAAAKRHLLFTFSNLLKGFRSYVDLSASEKLEFGSLMTNLFNYIEASYRTSGQGLLGEETMEEWSWFLRNRLLSYPGVCEWWSQMEGLFPPEMCDWVRRQIDSPDKTEDPYGLYDDA